MFCYVLNVLNAGKHLRKYIVLLKLFVLLITLRHKNIVYFMPGYSISNLFLWFDRVSGWLLWNKLFETMQISKLWDKLPAWLFTVWSRSLQFDLRMYELVNKLRVAQLRFYICTDFHYILSYLQKEQSGNRCKLNYQNTLYCI